MNRLMHEGKIPQNEFGITDFQPFFFVDYPQDHYPPGSLPPGNCSLDNSFMGRGPNTTTLKKTHHTGAGTSKCTWSSNCTFFYFSIYFPFGSFDVHFGGRN